MRPVVALSQPANVSDRLKVLRDGLYAALQRAVDVFGGEQAFASAMGVSLTDTHLRVNRKEDSKLKLQRAFYDFVAYLALDETAAMSWLRDVSELLGCEPPVQRRVVTEGDIGRAAADWVRSLPPSMRAAALEDMARALGVRAGDLKL